MAIRTAVEEHYPKLVLLFKEFFPTHNIFQQSDLDILTYVKEHVKIHELIVLEEDGVLSGALYLVKTGQNIEGTHKRWKFRHFAFKTEEDALKLLGEAEKRVKQGSKTAKIELTIAETEEGIEFYKKNGYSEEGALKNHYRWAETCFILGKSFSSTK